MKIYECEFENNFLKLSNIPELKSIPFKWEKSSEYKGYKYTNSTSTAEEIAQQTFLKAAWDTVSLEEAKQNYPKYVELPYTYRKYIITQEQFNVCYQFCKVTQIIDIDTTSPQVQAIDINLLAKKLAENLKSIIGATNTLHVTQPNMPLFTYNEFMYLEDCNITKLQEWINKDWRVVSINHSALNEFPNFLIGIYKQKD